MKISTKFGFFIFSTVFAFYQLSFESARGQCTSNPSVVAPTSTSITTTTATLGGTAASTGGGTCAISDRGIYWTTTTGQELTGTKVSAGGTTTGTFSTSSVSGLPPGTKIYYVAYATNSNGTGISGESFFYTLSSAPLAQPTSFSVSSVTNNTVNLSFTAPNNVSVAAAGYAIFRIVGTTPPSVTSGNLPNANTPASASPLPDGSVYVGSTASASSSSYADNTVSAATQYSYALIPFGYDGTNAATYNYLITSYKTVTAPYTLSNPPSGQPTSLSSAAATSTQINLTINWGAVTASGFLIYRNTTGTPVIAGGDFSNGTLPPNSLADGSSKVASVSSLATSYNDVGLTAATQYYYVLVPFGYDGSNAATYNYNTTSPKTTNSFTFYSPPSGQPTSLSSAAASNTQIDLTINWGAVTASGFLIYRNTTGTPVIAGGDFSNGTLPPNSLADGSSKVASVSSLATSYNDVGLTAATQYYYVLVPFGYDGSNAATYNYNTTSPKTTNSFTFYAPPSGQPTPLSASGVSPSQINLTWASVTATGFLIYRKAGSTAPNVSAIANGIAPPSPLGDGSTLINNAAGGATTYNNTVGLSAATQYSYTIVPYGYDGANAETYNYLIASAPTANAFTYSNPASGQPTSFSASATGSNSINLTWSSGVTCSGFLLYRLSGNTAVNLTGLNSGSAAPVTLGDGSILVTTVGSGATSFSNNSGLSSSTKYQYKLVPFTWDGINAGTYNFLTSGAKSSNATTFDNNSTITFNVGTATSSIYYINFPVAGGGGAGPADYTQLDNTIPNCVRLGQFTITDSGGDGLPTTLSSVSFSLANSGDVVEIAIFNSGNTNLGGANNPPGTISFNSGLSSISASDGSTDTFEIWATFKNTVTDQDVLQLTITSATVSASGSGLASFASTTGTVKNKIQVVATQLTVSTAASSVNVNSNFGAVTVSAVDALNNIQRGRTDAIALTISSGTGTLTTVPVGNQNLVNGTISWSSASINNAGSKTIRAAKTPITPNPLTAATTNVTINSPGVTVTPGTVNQMCYSGDYQTISAITITESDPSDFAVGSNVTFSMVLPTGFLFNNTITTAPTISGIPGPSTDLSAMSALSYTPDKTTVSFTYTVGATAYKDQIVINGLQVNYVGTTNVASANLVRLGGTAVQQGNATTDAKVFCTLSSQNSSTTVSFTVQTVPGQPSVNPTDTRFQVGINSVQLLGNPQSPSNGVFSGPGVSPNATYGYIFSPSSVGVSTGNQIVYTYQETSGQHCNVTATKSFDVYASVIQGIQTKYCTNAAPSPPLNVLQADVDNQFSPAGSNSYYDLVYLYSFGNSSSSSPGPLYLGLYPTTNYYYNYTYTYNLLGTTTAAMTVVNTYTYTYAYTLGYYVSYTYTSTPTVNYAAQGTINSFDPSQSYYRNYYSSGVYVYYRAKNNSTFAISLGGNQFVSLIPPPNVIFTMPKKVFCDYDNQVTLVSTSAPVFSAVSPTPSNPSTDKFTGAVGIGTALGNPSPNNWTFDPTLIGTKSAQIAITYQYQDPTTLCSDTAQQIVQINPKPIAVPLTNIKVAGVQAVNLYSCQNLPLSPTTGKFDATPISSPVTTYKWYSDAGLTTQAGVAGNTFVPPVDIATIGPTNYYVTQSVLGCESVGVTITTNITTPVSIIGGTPGAICSSSEFDISTLGSIGGLISGGVTTGTWSGNGNFVDASQNPSTSSSTAKFYTPTSTELSNGSAVITLTSDTPSAPNACPSVLRNYTIPISTAITVNPIAPITVCPGQSTNPIVISTIINGAGVSQATWSSSLAQGKFQDVSGLQTAAKPFAISATSGNPVQVVYIPSSSEISSGSNIILSDVTVTSNAAGACSAASQTVALTLNAAPKVSVGVDQIICADQPVVLSGGQFSGSASSASWTTSGTGSFSVYSISTNPVNTTYTLTSTELQNQSQQLLTFTLTTNDPDGTGPTGPCVPDAKTVNVTVNPIPQSPIINLPTYPSQQPAFCVNDALVSNLSASGASGNTINWYSNAAASGAPLVSGTLNTGAYVNNAFSGTTSFYATQKTSAGCESKGQIPNSSPAKFDLVINPNPTLSFSARGQNNNLTGLCLGDSTVLDASSSTIPSPGTIKSYTWDFLDGTPPVVKTTPMVTKYFALGNYNVQLTATSDKLCKSVTNASSLSSISSYLPTNSPLVIGPYPVANFTALGQCLGNATQFTALDLSNPSATTSGAIYNWDFRDGSTSSKQNPTHPFLNVLNDSVKLTITSNRGCVNSIVKPFYILPSINFTAANSYFYNESFEDNTNAPLNGGWSAQGFVVNSSGFSKPSWNLQSPNTSNAVINGASKGSQAWVAGLIPTNNNTYYLSDKSALNSPCFDLSGLTKPVINFDFISNTWKQNDGVYLEYSTDNGQNWSVLGSLSQGLNWYNDNFIIGLQTTPVLVGSPVGQSINQQGWDGNSRSWVTGAFSLANIGSGIRLRFVFGSNKSTDPSGTLYNGFGLDNVFIQNGNRTILAENFTNEAASGAASNDTNFINFESLALPQSLVKIQYHTNFGGADPSYALNPSDPLARASFYGITSSFKGFMDGADGTKSSTAKNNFNGSIAPSQNANPSNSENFFNTRALVPSPLLISLSTSATATEVTIDATLNTLSIALPPGTGNSNRYLVQMAIVENVGGQNILRKLLPDASGTPLTALAANSSQTITYKWQSSSPINPANLAAICFVQDQTNQDVLQAASVVLPTTNVITAIEPISSENVKIYPNPSDKEFTITLPSPATQTTSIQIANQVGQFVDLGVFNEGEQTKTISTQSLTAGVYILMLGNNGGAVRTKIVVVHK